MPRYQSTHTSAKHLERIAWTHKRWKPTSQECDLQKAGCTPPLTAAYAALTRLDAGEPPQQIALAEAAVAVLGERRMIGDVAVEPQGRPTSTSDEPRPSSSNAKGSPVAASRRSLPAYGPFSAFGPPGCPKTYFRVDQFNGVDQSSPQLWRLVSQGAGSSDAGRGQDNFRFALTERQSQAFPVARIQVKCLILSGAAREIRTPDPIITNDVLYQLSYCGPVEQRRTGANRTALLSMPVLPVLAIR